MKDSKLQFDWNCHALYSKPCKKQIQKKIVHHYPKKEQEAVWERVQCQYVDFLSDWRTDLGGKKNFHNGVGGTYDCIALMAYYTICKEITNLEEIEEMESAVVLPVFRVLSKFIDCNKPLFKKLCIRSLRMPKRNVRSGTIMRCTSHLLIWINLYIMNLPLVLLRSLQKRTIYWRLCPLCATSITQPWKCFMQN